MQKQQSNVRDIIVALTAKEEQQRVLN